MIQPNGVHIIGETVVIYVSEFVQQQNPQQYPFSLAVVRKAGKDIMQVSLPIDDPRTEQVASPDNARNMIAQLIQQNISYVFKMFKPQTQKAVGEEAMRLVAAIRNANVRYVPKTDEEIKITDRRREAIEKLTEQIKAAQEAAQKPAS